MAKIKIKVECQECDSPYEIKYSQANVKELNPKFCTFCGEELLIDDSDEDIELDDDDYYSSKDWE